MKLGELTIQLAMLHLLTSQSTVSGASVPLRRVFELPVLNSVDYANPFSDVWLNATFTGPSTAQTHFWGFYDGGSTWRIRFMPGELGTWTFSWGFSDGSKSGDGQFECIANGSSPGILKPYSRNPHWFAYQGKQLVFLKSYYNKAGGALRQDAGWVHRHLYSKMNAR